MWTGARCLRRAFSTQKSTYIPSIRSVLSTHDGKTQQDIKINGWIVSSRVHKNATFLMVNDGSNITGMQVVVDTAEATDTQYDLTGKVAPGTSISITGTLKPHPSSTPPPGQEFEMHTVSNQCSIMGPVDETYPLQKKYQTFEHLRSVAHLRLRTSAMAATARIRSKSVLFLHQFFQMDDYIHCHTPILTPLDCEGAGELFEATTTVANTDGENNENNVEENNNDESNENSEARQGKNDFFGKPVYLTVSGQLYGEMCSSALGKIYTFGPTFRAENSHTTRHLAEFWMLEPEISYAKLPDLMDIAEGFMKYVVTNVFQHCKGDLSYLNDKVSDKALIPRLEIIQKEEFARITYTEAIEIISTHYNTLSNKKKKKFGYIKWGDDLTTPHERYLAEEYFNKPVFVTHYPASIKPFYMKRTIDEEGRSVALCLDLLVPGIGEVVGGSEREEDFNQLQEQMKEHNLCGETYEWYLDLRRYGSVPHGGFGLGFERMIQLLSGMENVRDVVIAPRAAGLAKF